MVPKLLVLFPGDRLFHSGTVVEEKIYHDAGSTESQSLRRGDLLRLIRAAGREPVERNTLYRPVERTESAFTVLVWASRSLVGGWCRLPTGAGHRPVLG